MRPRAVRRPAACGDSTARRGFRQGLISNLANPKVAVLLHEPRCRSSSAEAITSCSPFLLLGGLFVAMTLAG